MIGAAMLAFLGECQKVRRNGRYGPARVFFRASIQSATNDGTTSNETDQMNRHSYRYSCNQCCATRACRLSLDLVICSLCSSRVMGAGQAVIQPTLQYVELPCALWLDCMLALASHPRVSCLLWPSSNMAHAKTIQAPTPIAALYLRSAVRQDFFFL